MKCRKLLCILTGIAAQLSAQNLNVIDTRFYCNGHKETISQITDVIQTKDKGFAFVGSTLDSGGGILPNCSSLWRHGVIGKLDSVGNVEWIKNQCDVGYWGRRICQTPDGGIVSDGGPITEYGMEIFRYDSKGDLLWNRVYGKGADAGVTQILATPDHGFLLSGIAMGVDADIPYNYTWPPITFQPADWVLMKLDSLGNKEWVRVLGTSGDESQSVALVSPDNYYYLIGCTVSKDHDCADTINHPGGAIYTIKLDRTGNTIWSRAHGRGYPINAMFDARDNTIMVTGRAYDNGNEFTGHQGYDDMFLMKLDTAGNFGWGKLYGTPFIEWGRNVCGGPGKSYLMIGDGYDTSIEKGFILNIDSAGSLLNQKIITGDKGGIAYRGIFPFSNEYAILGYTYSNQFSEGTGTNCKYGMQGSGALFLSRLQWSKTKDEEPHSSSQTMFSIAPNPVHGSFELIFQELHPNGNLNCVDATGRSVYRQKIDGGPKKLRINSNAWQAGVYVLCYETTTGQYCEQVTIR